MTLKTLKDLPCACRKRKCHELILPKVIRAEAIKWVKHFDEMICDTNPCHLCNWIKDFFNITEDDLK